MSHTTFYTPARRARIIMVANLLALWERAKRLPRPGLARIYDAQLRAWGVL